MKNTANNKYQHYKTGQIYEMIGIAYHSETKEEMVVYKGLYDCEKFGKTPCFVRPKKMFFEEVLWNGQYVPRFKPIENEEIDNFSVSI